MLYVIVLLLLLTCSGSLDILLNLTELQFSHLKNVLAMVHERVKCGHKYTVLNTVQMPHYYFYYSYIFFS